VTPKLCNRFLPSGFIKLGDKTTRATVEQTEGSGDVLVLENVGETRLNDNQNTAIVG